LIQTQLKKILQFFQNDIWNLEFEKLSQIQIFLIKVLQTGFLVIRSFIDDRLLVRASALVYSSLLSIVPLLAVMFSVLKAFGVHYAMEPTLKSMLAPLGANAEIITTKIVTFVENTQVSAIGYIGMAVLFFAVISIVNNIDRAFNDIWRVKKSRTFRRKFADYISLILVGPVFVFAVLGITASLKRNDIVQAMFQFRMVNQIIAKMLPYIVSWIIFTFLSVFVPNTKVKWQHAFLGAVIGGTFWQVSNWAFASIVVESYQSGAKAVLYASFAALPLFLIWLFVGWSCVLLSAEITHILQNLEKYKGQFRANTVSPVTRESLALKLLVLVGKYFYMAKPPLSKTQIADHLTADYYLVAEITQWLKQAGMLSETDEGLIQPACDFSNLSVKQVWDKIRGGSHSNLSSNQEKTINDVVKHVEGQLNDAVDIALGSQSLQDLVLQSLEGKTNSAFIT
jgi:membrane protein